MIRIRPIASALAVALLPQFPFAPVAAQTSPRTINVALVSKTSIGWPMYIAKSQGYFAAAGLKLEVEVVGSAARTSQQLVAGAADIAEDSTSQVIEAVLGGAPLALVLVKTTSSPYAIMGKKGIASLAALKGKTMIVGGPNDITRVYSDAALAKAGIKPEDVTYTYAGGSSDRFAALMSGTVDAAILVPPFNFMAESSGNPTLDEMYKYFSAFPIDNFAVNTTWAKGHEEIVTAFLGAYLKGVRDFYNPALRAKSIQALVDATNSKPDDAAKTYDYLAKIKFYSPTGISSNADLQRVVDTLLKTGDLKPPAPAPSKYSDFALAEKANGILKQQK